jgi:hypothetical protein
MDRDAAYTMLRDGIAVRRVPAGPRVAFDIDADGAILGAIAEAGADWVAALIDLVIAGKVRLDSGG